MSLPCIFLLFSALLLSYSYQNVDTPLLLLSGDNFPKEFIKIHSNAFSAIFPMKSPQHLSWKILDRQYCSYDSQYVCISSKLRNTWLSISTNESYSNGLSSWCYYIHHMSNQNICFGMSTESIASTIYLGSTNTTWSYTATGYLYYDGKRTLFGPPLKEGDILKLIVNHSKGTLSVTVNNVFIGIGFYNVPKNTRIYPSISFFNPGDIVQIYNGNHVQLDYEKPASDLIEITQTVMNRQNDSQKWLNNVPPERLKKAKEMVSMGYNIYTCVLALERCKDHILYATDYLLNNQEALNKESHDLQVLDAQYKKEMKEENEIQWMVDAYCSETRSRSAKKLQWLCKYCNTFNMAEATLCRTCKKKKPSEDNACILYSLVYGHRSSVRTGPVGDGQSLGLPSACNSPLQCRGVTGA